MFFTKISGLYSPQMPGRLFENIIPGEVCGHRDESGS